MKNNDVHVRNTWYIDEKAFCYDWWIRYHQKKISLVLICHKRSIYLFFLYQSNLTGLIFYDGISFWVIYPLMCSTCLISLFACLWFDITRFLLLIFTAEYTLTSLCFWVPTCSSVWGRKRVKEVIIYPRFRPRASFRRVGDVVEQSVCDQEAESSSLTDFVFWMWSPHWQWKWREILRKVSTFMTLWMCQLPCSVIVGFSSQTCVSCKFKESIQESSCFTWVAS